MSRQSRRKPPELEEIQSLDEIPDFQTEAEEAEWWGTHTFSEELWDKLEPVELDWLPPPRPRTKPVSVRFDEDVVARLKTLAAKKHKGYQTMLKEFVLERLYEEEKREGIVSS